VKIRYSSLDRQAGRSTRYRTRYHVGTLRGRPVYWHPAEDGFCAEMDGSYLVEIPSRDVDGIAFLSTGKLLEDCAKNPGLMAALPAPLRSALQSDELRRPLC